MSAADDLRAYIDMQIVGVHPRPGDGFTLELGAVGHMGRRFVDVDGTDLAVTEPEAVRRANYRNRRGWTPRDPDWQAQQDYIGDQINEAEREDRE